MEEKSLNKDLKIMRGPIFKNYSKELQLSFANEKGKTVGMQKRLKNFLKS